MFSKLLSAGSQNQIRTLPQKRKRFLCELLERISHIPTTAALARTAHGTVQARGFCAVESSGTGNQTSEEFAYCVNMRPEIEPARRFASPAPRTNGRLHVAARRKGLGRAGKQNRVHFLVVGEVDPDVFEFVVQFGIDRVKCFEPVQGHRGKLVLPHAAVLADPVSLSPANRMRIRILQRRYERMFASILRAGIKKGIFVPGEPKLMTFVILRAANSVAVWFREGDKWQPEWITAQVTTDQLVRSITP